MATNTTLLVSAIPIGVMDGCGGVQLQSNAPSLSRRDTSGITIATLDNAARTVTAGADST
jgi:hypothetical protein